MRSEVKIFKGICKELHEASDATYPEVVNKVLQTRYRLLVDESSTFEIAYIFDVSKQFIEYTLSKALGTLHREEHHKPRTFTKHPNYKYRSKLRLIRDELDDTNSIPKFPR